MTYNVYVLPISGGYFVNQVAMLCELSSAGAKAPDIAMGSSGGNVTAYIGLAGGWTERGVMRIARELYPGIFAKPWTSIPIRILSWIIGSINGSLYKSDENEPCEAFFESYLGSCACTQVEVWTGTVNRSQNARMFCNRSESDSLLAGNYATDALMGCLPPVYMDGNPTRMGKAALASASIPTFVPPKEIDGELYTDGGGMFSDPLIPMQDRLRALVGGGGLHITLISGHDTEDAVAATRVSNVYSEGLSALRGIQYSMARQSRLCAVGLIRCGPGDTEMNFETGACDSEKLRSLLERRSKLERSLLELYPSIDNHISMTAFTQADIDKSVARARANYSYRMWWCETQHA